MNDMRRTVYGRNQRVDYWTLFGEFDVDSLRERATEGAPTEAASLAQALGDLAHADSSSRGHLLPVVTAALKRSDGNLQRALELSTIFYHVIRDVLGRNIANDKRRAGESTYAMFSAYQSYATILLSMDEMVEVMVHLSPGGDPPVELLSAMFL